MRVISIIILFLFLIAGIDTYATDSTTVLNKVTNFPNKLFSKVNKKTKQLNSRLDKQTEKYLKKLMKREVKLKEELYSLDSNGTQYLFLNNPQQHYAALIQNLKSDTCKLNNSLNTQYLPYLDSLQGTISFLNKNPGILSGDSKIAPADIQNSFNQLQGLQSKMQNAEQVRQFIIERKEQLKQYILLHSDLSKGIISIYNDYNKQLYYYSNQLQKYKQILNDPDKMLKTALILLNKLPAFSDFMKKNSFLAGLFNIPDNYNMQNALPGLQTRDMLNQIIQRQISSGAPNAGSTFNQSFQAAQGQLQQLKDKISSLGAGASNADLPANFKANNQKLKTFFQRLEYGTNIQNTHSNFYFPTTTDLGLSIGYKLKNENTIGIGASYKIGWGANINHIHVTSQGAGLRSFLDIKIKGGFYASGGYEYNYQKNSSSSAPNYIRDKNWSKSGLIGISKTISTRTKFFKKSKIQLLWDFLSYYQIPRGQPIKFRIGYNF